MAVTQWSSVHSSNFLKSNPADLIDDRNNDANNFIKWGNPVKFKTTLQLMIVCLVLAAGLITEPANAELTVASPISDNAIFQRDMPVPIWGTADSGATVEVSFAGQQKLALADSAGRWKVVLDPLAASFEPRELKIDCTDHAGMVVSNVLVGEVWICSGQSNMQMSVNAVPAVKALVPDVNNLRTFQVKRTVAFEEQETCQGKWVQQHPDSAVAYAFAHFLEQAADVPVGILLTCWGSSSIEAWMPRDMTETVLHFKTIMDEFDADSKTKNKIFAILNGPQPWSKQDDVFLRRQPNVLYNAMMHPLAPYACRGLVWYQGERNTRSISGMLKKPWYARTSGMTDYGDVLKKWIQRYRQQWEQPEMQFLIVMLPGFGKTLDSSPENGSEHPAAHSWAWIRESQLSALDLPHTSVANTIDLGHITDIHPKDKLPIGKRLALLAARDTPGQKILAQGPVMKSVQRSGDRIIVQFDHAEGLKTQDGKAPTAFWLADDSAQWVRAEAELSGDTVVLRSTELAGPLYVRYAFAGKPKVNLVNESGLPAYPFRTDTFKP